MNSPNTPLQIYKSDEGFDLARLWIFFTYGLCIGIPLAVIVDAITLYAGCWRILTGFMIGLYAIFIGGIMSAAGVAAKNRNRSVHRLCGLILALLLYYIQWLAFANLWQWEHHQSVVALWIYQPLDLWHWMVDLANSGAFSWTSTYSADGGVAGATVWIVWGLEFITVVLFPLPLGMDYMREPFYPQANEWGKKRKLAHHYLRPDGLPTPDEILHDERFEWMNLLYQTTQPTCLEIEMVECEGQPLSYFSLYQLTEGTDSKGNKTTRREAFIKYVELRPEDRVRFDAAVSAADKRTAADVGAADSATEEEDSATDESDDEDRADTATDDTAADDERDSDPANEPAADSEAASEPSAPLPPQPAARPAPPPAPPGRGGKVDDIWDE